jgi:hypothetical protein
MTSVLIVAHSACLAWASVGHTQDLNIKDKHEYDGELTSINILDYFCPCISNTA